ncbi:MAG TPA: DUF2760 domain-containing protein [Polyangiaceae bacterium]
MTAPSDLSFATRVWFAWLCFFRVLFDGAFAARVWSVREAAGTENAEPGGDGPEARPGAPAAPDRAAPPAASSDDAAVQLLGLLQREGRLVDFLQQDVAAFSDADIGAAARVVHDGCRKAIASHMKILPVREEREGGPITLDEFDPTAVKLVGNVGGTRPFRGTLRHRGWRLEALELPRRVESNDARVIAPAEVEL